MGKLRFLATAFSSLLLFVVLLRSTRQKYYSLGRSWAATSTPLTFENRFAYVQYATTDEYLCNAAMVFARLQELGCKASKLLLYSKDWNENTTYIANDQLYNISMLLERIKNYGVDMQPIQIQHRDTQDETWKDSYTKLLAFNQTQYERVLSLDSDSVVLQCMDELFELPEASVALPRAYWLPQPHLSSQIMLVEPSKNEFATILDAIHVAEGLTFDMDIMNNLYMDKAYILPHRGFDMLTGEFRKKNHTSYLEGDAWDAYAMLEEAKYVHFSDFPVPKYISASSVREHAPEDASDERDIWLALYGDYKRRRMEVCGLPDWGGAIRNATVPIH